MCPHVSKTPGSSGPVTSVTTQDNKSQVPPKISGTANKTSEKIKGDTSPQITPSSRPRATGTQTKPKEMTATQVRKHLDKLQTFDDKIEKGKAALAKEQKIQDDELAQIEELKAKIAEAEKREKESPAEESTVARVRRNSAEIDNSLALKKSAQALPMIGGIRINTEDEGRRVTEYAFKECILKNKEAIAYSETAVDGKLVKHVTIHDVTPLVKFMEMYKANATKCDFRNFELSNIEPLMQFLSEGLKNGDFKLVGEGGKVSTFVLTIGCKLAKSDIQSIATAYEAVKAAKTEQSLEVVLKDPETKQVFDSMIQ